MWHCQRPLWSTLNQKAPALVDYVSTSWPQLKGVLARSKFKLLARAPQPWKTFIGHIEKADALLVSGGGFINDVFDARTEKVLDLIMLAHSREVPVFMFSQGMGPLRSPKLRNKARRALQDVELIALREKKRSYSLLRDLGMAESQLKVTGDDSICLAHSASPKQLRDGIGVNLRIANYSNLDANVARMVGDTLTDLSRDHSASIYPVPIEHEGENSDIQSIREILTETEVPTGPLSFSNGVESVIQNVGKCRVVVTGSYHGAVFALSQGIPAVGLSSSTYYDAKFGGLKEMFGGGLTLLDPTTDDFSSQLRDAISHQWNEAPTIRPSLLDAARSQIQASRDAYSAMADHF
jgi:colanic acid/amylovoran biosynthesis protein